ncbi:MAG: phosphoribosylglycinamide formyltransferase [Bacteroidia bacterium]|nr:phosphoribosylglycinamide formyltransferase [Bacteroidia bacterium]
MKKIAIFASGSGSNVQNIVEFLSIHPVADVALILTNNPNAYVIERAKNLDIPYFIFDKNQFYHSNEILNLLCYLNLDLIVLAGFLWLIPDDLIKAFPDKIINIHPALLPKYGGKGMYGNRVHEAVISNKEKESGITIHYVSEKYDEGQIIFHAKCQVLPEDTAESLALKVHELEYIHYPKVICNLLS